MKCIVNGDVVLSLPLEGPLSAHIAAFAAWSREQGYALRSRYRQVLLAACFSRWLRQQAVSVRRVCAEHPTQYLRSRARRVKIHSGDADRCSPRTQRAPQRSHDSGESAGGDQETDQTARLARHSRRSFHRLNPKIQPFFAFIGT